MSFIKQLLNSKIISSFISTKTDEHKFRRTFAQLWKDYCHARQLSVDAYCWGTTSSKR